MLDWCHMQWGLLAPLLLHSRAIPWRGSVLASPMMLHKSERMWMVLAALSEAMQILLLQKTEVVCPSVCHQVVL